MDNRHNEKQLTYFWDILLKDYILNGYVTLVQLHYSSRDWESPFYQFGSFLDGLRRFAKDTKYIWLGDCDEFLIPKPVNNENDKISTEKDKKYVFGKNTKTKTKTNVPILFDWHFNDIDYSFNDIKKFEKNQNILTVTDIVQRIFADDKNLDGIETYTYPSLPPIYHIWNNNNNNNTTNNILGCNKTDSNNLFDTYLQRQSCLHWKTVERDDFYDSIHIPLTIVEKLEALLIYNQLEVIDRESNYEVRTKLILDAEKVEIAIHHNARSRRTNNDGYGDDVVIRLHNQPNSTRYMMKYDLFAVHTRDHFNHLEKNEVLIDFKKEKDMKYFYQYVTQHNCDFQDLILYWNDLFLNDEKYGVKWKNKKLIEPLVDNDGVFCYLKDENYKLEWKNNVKVFKKSWKKD